MRRALFLACLALFGLAAASATAQPRRISLPDLAVPAPAIGGGSNDAAVLVAVEDYAELPDIPGATSNTEDWFVYLTETLGVPESRVTTLYDKRGTREKFLKALRAQSANTKKGGTLWVVFVGHGTSGSASRDALMIGYDAQAEAESLEERSLGLQELLGEVRKGKQSRVVAVIDAATSGQAPDGSFLARAVSSSAIDYGAVAAGYKKKAKQELVVLAAASSGQAAQGLPGARRPAFGYLALGALRGWADVDGSGTVTVQELREYTAAVLLVLTPGGQTPSTGASKSSLALSLALEEGPDLSGLLAGGGTPGRAPGSSGGSGTGGGTPSVPEPSVGTGSKPAAGIEAMEAIIFEQVNLLREANGLKPFSANTKLIAAARGHSEEMAKLNYFSHTSPTAGRRDFTDRIALAGGKSFGAAGENIAFRAANISEEEMALGLFQQWVDSPPHLENMLAPEFRTIGIGLFRDGSRVWATQVFADQVK